MVRQACSWVKHVAVTPLATTFNQDPRVLVSLVYKSRSSLWYLSIPISSTTTHSLLPA